MGLWRCFVLLALGIQELNIKIHGIILDLWFWMNWLKSGN